jgi:DNA-binding protein HU-beta
MQNKETCEEKQMNKADLVDKIAGACEISKAQATTAVDTAVSSITGALKKGDRVALIGFGTFSVSQRKARNGRNPQTGATIKIAARKVAKFTPGAELKKTVNKKYKKQEPSALYFHENGRGSALPFSLPDRQYRVLST